MDLHTLFEAIGSVSLIAAATFLWKVSGKFNVMASTIQDIKSNHLPHLSEDIKAVGKKIDRHIEWHAGQRR